MARLDYEQLALCSWTLKPPYVQDCLRDVPLPMWMLRAATVCVLVLLWSTCSIAAIDVARAFRHSHTFYRLVASLLWIYHMFTVQMYVVWQCMLLSVCVSVALNVSKWCYHRMCPIK
jgi:hypothetical protein